MVEQAADRDRHKIRVGGSVQLLDVCLREFQRQLLLARCPARRLNHGGKDLLHLALVGLLFSGVCFESGGDPLRGRGWLLAILALVRAFGGLVDPLAVGVEILGDPEGGVRSFVEGGHGQNEGTSEGT